MTSLHDEWERKLQNSNATPISLPLQFLKAITCDFSTECELGRGGYGVVYKGVLPSGKIIAVKKLFEIHLVDDKTFQKEVSSLMEIKHQHVVQFIGYCAESSFETIKQQSGKFIWAEIPKRLLCFEYLCNKSLDKYISVPIDESPVLEWNMRYEIIKGICNGLNFLHEDRRMVHLDLKPENILMDATMLPKISDFGLSRIFGNQQTRILANNSVGSRGYMAPEYLIQGIITMKADIFSLGVIIIEIITGRRDYPYFQLDNPESNATSCGISPRKYVLASWRYKFESTVKYTSIEKYNQQVKQCITIALKCVDPGMDKRPTANDVIQVLNVVDQMEASKELPSEMQCHDKPLVLDTSICKALILDIMTEDMTNIRTGGTVGDVKKSQECLLPTPLWSSSTGSQNHQEATKESTEPQRASDRTSEMEAHEELSSNMPHTDKLLVLNTSASKVPTLRSFIEDMLNNKIDGNVVDETTSDGLSPPLPLESSTDNQNYQEAVRESSQPQIASDRTTEVIPGSTEDMFNNKIDGKVVAETTLESSTDKEVKEIKESNEPRLSSDTTAENYDQLFHRNRFHWNYQEAVKESNKPRLSSDTTAEVTISSSILLDVHPLELNFPIEPNKSIACSLHLTNNKDKQVVFRLMEKRYNWMCFLKLPLYGIVPPRSTYTLVVTTGKTESLPKERSVDLILQSSESDEYVMPFKRGYDCDQYFEKAKKLENAVHMVALKAIYAQNGETSCENHREAAKESSEPQQACDKTSEVIPGSSTLLDVYPLEFFFRFEPNKLISCSLNLRNNTAGKVAFRLIQKSNERTCFLSTLPMFGVVEPRTTYTLVVIRNKHENLPRERNVDLILQTNAYCKSFSDVETSRQHFHGAGPLGTTAHQVTLKGVCALQGETIFEHSIPPLVKIISMENKYSLQDRYIYTIDANQIEPLIITGRSFGYVHIWNYDTQKFTGSVRIPNGEYVRSVKFIARKGWFLVGSNNGFIHVYNYKKEMQSITTIKAHGSHSNIDSLAIHPTQSYVLSASGTEIKLWVWDHSWFSDGHRWKCMQTFKEHSGDVHAVAFNPNEYNRFASASYCGTIKVWSLRSPKSKYTLSGHSGRVHCLDFFASGDGQQYLITGSDDKTAKIWDMQKKECVRTLPHNSEVRSVLPHPKLPVLVTGTEDGHVHLWSSINFRLKRILHIGCLSWVHGLAWLIDSGRVVVAQKKGLSVIENLNEEE